MTTIIKEKIMDRLPLTGGTSSIGYDAASSNLLKKISGMDRIAFLSLLDTKETGLSESAAEETLANVG
ncbi:MAG: hypothetical protein JWO06_2763, partial [Bacteroidota bacterium]|nr:hypothetical protein [Bacteroidota bacterium]